MEAQQRCFFAVLNFTPCDVYASGGGISISISFSSIVRTPTLHFWSRAATVRSGLVSLPVDYRKRHQPTPHWLWTVVQAVNRTSGRSGSASEDDPAERGCSRWRTTLGSTPTTPGGSHMTASLGGRYDPLPVKRSTD